MTTFKAMKAADYDPKLQKFPCLASPKIDGYRGNVIRGAALAYSQKIFPNPHTQKLFGRVELDGFDGEFTVGPPNAPNVIQRTAEIRRAYGEPDVHFHVFDDFSIVQMPFIQRQDMLQARLRALHEECGGEEWMKRIHLVTQTVLTSAEELDDYEARALRAGYEGVMLRSPDGPYKLGRSTAREGWLVKVKRFKDKEAFVSGMSPAMHNTNEAVRNALGNLERSSAKDGLVAMDMVGTIHVYDFDGPNGERRDYDISPGKMDHNTRKAVWATRDVFLNSPVKFKYFPHGEKDVPRHGSFLEFRDPLTMA